MYVKIIGFLLVTGGAGAVGILKNATIGDQNKLYMSLYDSVNLFANEIKYKSAPLYDALMKASKIDISGVFLGSAQKLFSLGSVMSFKEAAKKIEDKQAREIMSYFADGLCATDKEELIKHAEGAMARLKCEAKNAEEKRKKYSKMYVNSGFLLGAAIGIILL